VEVAVVLKRGGLDWRVIAELVESIEETLIIVVEYVIYGKALEIAMDRALSGFDTYSIALALMTGSTLITDDKSIAGHAKALGTDTILIREAGLEYIREKLTGKHR